MLLADVCHRFRFYHVCLSVFLVREYPVVQSESRAESARENLAQQVGIVLLHIFIYEHAWQFHQYFLGVLVVVFEHHGLEHCAELLFRDILLYKPQSLAPDLLGSPVHQT